MKNSKAMTSSELLNKNLPFLRYVCFICGSRMCLKTAIAASFLNLATCEMPFPQQGSNPEPPALRTWSLDHQEKLPVLVILSLDTLKHMD